MAVTDETIKKIINITLIVMSIIILIGIVLTVYFLTADKHVIKISIEPDETESVHFEKINIVPGDECEYTLLLSSEYEYEYELTLRFEDLDPEQILKDYAYVRMERDGEIICDELLSKAFEGEKLVLSVNFLERETNDIRVIYYMPADVGNEAQNAEANFNLYITATNK